MTWPRIIIITVFIGSSLAQTLQLAAQPTIQYRPVINALNSPVDIVHANDQSNRLFIVEKGGTIKVYDQCFGYTGDFLQVAGVSTLGERGLLSLAFHPNYKTNGKFFIYYTNAQGNIEVSSYNVSTDPNKADPNSKKIIITIPHPGASNHNGGKLNFGPDGYLYFATGDGGGGGDQPNNSQNTNLLLGKMIRIDIDNTDPPLQYRIPSDNPFTNDAAVADEIWAIGLRNPWRWSFDRLTGDLWIGDVGQNAREEINFLKTGQHRGVNYGWRCYEGLITYNANGCQAMSQYITPIFDYRHNNTDGGFCVTGGYVYRGKEFPALNGYYIFTDYVSGNHWTISNPGNNRLVEKLTGNLPGNITAYGEGEDGSLYACSLTPGTVYKIEALSGVAFQLLSFTGAVRNNIAELNWSASEQNLQQYEVESSGDSINFERKTVIPAKNSGAGNIYSFTDQLLPGIEKIFYRLRVLDNNGKWDYSNTIAVTNHLSEEKFIFPSVISNGVISCFIPTPHDLLQVFSINGTLVIKKDIRSLTGRIDIPVFSLAKGMYFVKISGSSSRTQRIFLQ